MATNTFTRREQPCEYFFPITTYVILDVSRNDPEFVISWASVFVTVMLDILLWSLVLIFIIFALILFSPFLIINYVCWKVIKKNK